MNNTNNNRGSTRSTNSATGSHAEDEVLSRAIRLSLEQQNAAQYSSNHSAYTTSNRSYDRQDYGGGSNYRSSPGQMQCREADVRTLIGLGFTPNQAMNALMQNNNNVEMAANSLFGLG